MSSNRKISKKQQKKPSLIQLDGASWSLLQLLFSELVEKQTVEARRTNRHTEFH